MKQGFRRSMAGLHAWAGLVTGTATYRRSDLSDAAMVAIGLIPAWGARKASQDRGLARSCPQPRDASECPGPRLILDLV